jgi:hypothetical protein
MPQPRSSQISLLDTPNYHCVSRCVRCSLLVARLPYLCLCSHEYPYTCGDVCR